MKFTSASILLIALTICFAPALTATPDCTASNNFLTWLKTQAADAVLSVANTSRPSTGWEVCDTTWGTDGTCCDVTKVKAAFKLTATGVKKSWDDFIQGFKKFMDISKTVKAAAGGANAKAKFDTMAGDSTYDLKGLTSDQAQTIINKIDNLGQDLQTFKNKASACFQASSNIRSSIFCAGCQVGTAFTLSGSALTYTFQSGSCNDALAACVPVWSFMFNMQAQMLLAVQAKRKDNGGKGTAPQGPPAVPKGKTFGDLATLFSSCPDGKVVAGSCTQDQLDQMCGLFISFKKPEPIAKPVDTTDAGTVGTSRLLQSSSADDGTGSAGSGLALNAETKPIPADTSVDASSTGSSTSNSGNILLVGLIGLVASMIPI